jgi:sugar O-acyltransferase (sialic acid O-acetyltransferase NeuD family)
MGERKILVYGASGHGKVVIDILLELGVPGVLGFVDDGRDRQGRTVAGFPVLGDGEWLRAEAARAPLAVALGIGDNRARQRVAERCVGLGAALVTAIHPRAMVSRLASVGDGAVVMAGAVVNPDAAVGRGVIVNTGAVIEHDVSLGDFSHVSPGAALGGAAKVGALSHIGLGASVLPGVAIGARVVVGAGATVTRDLEDAVVAVGVPARVIRRLDG